MVETYFSWMDEPERTWCEELQSKMLELLSVREWGSNDELWAAASSALGNEDERYCQIYVCEQCGELYHGDYSSSSAPERDFCGMECEVMFFSETL